MTTKYDLIANILFVKNRKKFINKMIPKSIAVFNSNDVYPVSADSTMPFQQHRDIFYLSGIDQEESILVLFPDAYHEEHREMLFLRETNDHIAVWEGEKLTKENATKVSGIKNIYWLTEFDKIFYDVMSEAQSIYLNRNEHYRASVQTQTRDDRFITMVKSKYPLHQILRSNPILQYLRSIKESEELALIQHACDITEKGVRRLLDFVKPGIWEYEIEAELIHEFIRNKSKGFAYTPIIASGNNANVLHYVSNNMQLQDGDLLLLDIGAEYANYSSDLTRTLPVNGRYTERQKQIYHSVLQCKKEAEIRLVAGNNWYDFHKDMGEVYTYALLDLGLIDKADVQNQDSKYPAYKKYMMHGTSHHMGLDTHDYGLLSEVFVENMVFTIEPGFYIPKEKMAVRLEDDYIVQNDGIPKNLMQNIPIEIDDIENLMN